jgi:hypothetical protein
MIFFVCQGRGVPVLHSPLFWHQLLTSLTTHGLISPKLRLLRGHTTEQHLAIDRDWPLAAVVEVYEKARKTLPLRCVSPERCVSHSHSWRAPSERLSPLWRAGLPPTSLCNLSILFSVTPITPLPPPLVYSLLESMRGFHLRRARSLVRAETVLPSPPPRAPDSL